MATSTHLPSVWPRAEGTYLLLKLPKGLPEVISLLNTLAPLLVDGDDLVDPLRRTESVDLVLAHLGWIAAFVVTESIDIDGHGRLRSCATVDHSRGCVKCELRTPRGASRAPKGRGYASKLGTLECDGKASLKDAQALQTWHRLKLQQLEH